MAETLINNALQDNNKAGTNFGEGSTRVVFQGIEYVVNANEVRSFTDDSTGAAVDTGANLRLADSRDADNRSGQAGRT